MGFTEGAFQIRRGALITVRIHAECVLAAGRRIRNLIVLARSTVHTPIVVAVIVYIALAVKQQAVLALFQRQRS